MRLEASELNHSGHVDDVVLDAVRAGEMDVGSLPHLDECDRCEGRVDLFTNLAEELALSVLSVQVPPAKDAAIRAAARSAAARGRRRRLLWIAPALVAAAAVLLFVVVGSGKGTSHEANVVALNGNGPVAALDVNRDGQVDILDAFALARTLEAGSATRVTWDANGDDVVDTRDVDAIARRVVRLTPAGKGRR